MFACIARSFIQVIGLPHNIILLCFIYGSETNEELNDIRLTTTSVMLMQDSATEQRAKSVEHCPFPGFVDGEQIGLPGQLEAPQIMHRVTKAQDFSVSQHKSCYHHHIVSAMALSHRTYPSFISAMSSRLGLSPKCVQLVMMWFRSHVAAPHIQFLLSR